MTKDQLIAKMACLMKDMAVTSNAMREYGGQAAVKSTELRHAAIILNEWIKGIEAEK